MNITFRKAVNLLVAFVVIMTMLFPEMQPASASAQAGDGIHREYNAETGRITLITGENNRPIFELGDSALSMTPEDLSLTLVQRFAVEFGLTDPTNELRLSRINQPDADRVVSKYQQVYQGVPVMAGELIVNANKAGELLSMNGEVSPGLSLDTNPELSVEAALEIAKQGMTKWYGGEAAGYNASAGASLWIFDERLLRSSIRPVELVWRIEIVSARDGAPIRELVLVDAKTGNISLHFNQIDIAWTAADQSDHVQTPVDNLAVSIETTPVPPTPAAPEIPSGTPQVNISGAAWYVATTGDDANDCATPATPCATINGALGKAVDGDMIGVAVGTYTGSGTEVVLIDKGITLSGGWDAAFSTQVGTSIIDGQKSRRGIKTTGTPVFVDHFTVQNGYDYYSGGGISNSGTMTLSESFVNDNESNDGGGISTGGIYINGTYTGGIVTINNTVISDNLNHSRNLNGDSTSGGGGIYIYHGTVILNNSIVRNNRTVADLNGSGILSRYSTLTLNNSTVSGNKTSEAIYQFYGTIDINSTTISGNTAGAISKNEGSLTVNNSTISNNTSAHSSLFAGINSVCTTPSPFCLNPVMKNSILYGNTNNGVAQDCKGLLVSAGHNIINANGCGYSMSAGDLPYVNPNLGPLIGTPGYMPLLQDSPAIDAGSPSTCLPTDQRGVLRPQASACDIGAYEYTLPGDVARLSSVDGNEQSAVPTLAFPQSFKIAALDSQGSPVANVNVIFTAPSSGASGVFSDTGSVTTSAVTDSNGIAVSSIFTANDQVGPYSITASASGVSSIDFSIQNAAWYVATTGDDLNSCLTPTSPCATINGALNKAGWEDTVLVGEGTYRFGGDVTQSAVVLINKDITLLGGWDSTFTIRNGSSILDGQNGAGGIVKDCADSWNIGVTASIDHFIVKNAGGYGGIKNCGDLKITNSSIHHNYIGGSGAGINSTSGNVTLDNVTVSNNTAYQYGGGIFISEGTLSLNNSTVTGNVAQYGSGIKIDDSYNSDATVILKNSILAGNSGNSNSDCSGPITSLGYNIIGNNSGCSFIPAVGDQVGTRYNPISPRLTSVQADGTQALMIGSPAINAGNPAVPGSGGDSCLPTDQLGTARPVDQRCDIGAYEGTVQWMPVPLVNTYNGHSSSASELALPGYLLCNQEEPNCTNGIDLHADAAHVYALGTYDLYAAKHLRDSIDNKGLLIISTVHSCGTGYCPYANAYWDGAQMIYGDAYGFPLADDVVAHELTHGVTQYESNLFYFYQSGAINESFSDVWGEYYDQTNGRGTDTPAVKWLLGEDVSGLGAIRYMGNPPSFGDPDKMTSPNYDFDVNFWDNGGVHSNSGINNKAVFLMVDGGIFNSKTVSAIGWDKTAAIYYEAQTNLLSSGADYSDLYYAVQQACVNLTGQFGINAGDCQQVRNALDAVEMYAQPAVNYNPDAALCAPGMSVAPIFKDDMESGSSKWTMTGAWSLASGYASSSANMLYGDDFYTSSVSSAEMAAGVVVPVAANTYLHFKHAIAFEYYGNEYYDGGVLEYSVDNGGSWWDASPLFVDGQNYKGTIMNYYGTTNVLKGRNAFVGDSHGYVSSRYNLTSLGGQTVKFRWRFATDSSYSYLGWIVDDVQIFNCGYNISGNVGIAGVTLSYIDGMTKTVTSQQDGSYSFTIPYNWSGTVTPSHICYTFNPKSRSYGGVSANQAAQNYTPKPCAAVKGDYDGDGKTNIAVFRPSNSTWYIKGQGSLVYGQSGDIPVSADYNADRKVDVAVFRPSNNTWYIKGQGSFVYGQSGDIPVPADYNGDGKAEIAIFRPSNSTWYIKGVGSFVYGTVGDIPVVADYNGDGKADIAVFRPSNSTWYIKGVGLSLYGAVGDIPVIADYNGDGKADIAVFRPSNSTWYIKGVGSFVYGTVNDIPVVGDYNGDGKADIAVFRPSNNTWYIKGIGPSVYGMEGDIPV